MKSENRKLLFWAFGVLFVFNLLNWVAPFLVASSSKFLQIMGSSIYFLLDPACHQLPDRSLHLMGIPLALCVRCTFLYLGILTGILFALIRKQIAVSGAVVAGVILFVAVEVVSEHLKFYSNWAVLRGFSGFVSGFILTLFFLQSFAVKGTKKEDGKRENE